VGFDDNVGGELGRNEEVEREIDWKEQRYT